MMKIFHSEEFKKVRRAAEMLTSEFDVSSREAMSAVLRVVEILDNELPVDLTFERGLPAEDDERPVLLVTFDNRIVGPVPACNVMRNSGHVAGWRYVKETAK